MNTEVKLGIFVVLVSSAFAFLILTFGEIPIFKEETKTYVVYFDDVRGLSKGAEVRVAGIRAGTVKEVKLKEGKVEVIFEVRRDIKIYRNASASIGTLGLMGDKYLSIKPGSPYAGELKEGEEIKKVEVVSDTDKLIAELTKTAKEFRQVAETLNEVLKENKKAINQTIAHLNNLMKNLNELTVQNKENINVALKNLRELTENLNRNLPVLLASLTQLSDNLNKVIVENREDLRSIVFNLSVILEDIRNDIPVVMKNLKELSGNLNTIVKLNKRNINRTLVSLRETTERLSRVSAKLENILSQIEEGKGTIGKLIKEEELYEDVRKTLRPLGKFGQVVEKTNLYIGLRGELYREGDSKGILTVKLEPDDKKYYLLEIVGDSRGRVYTEEYLDGRESVKKEFKPELTLQYARNFNIFGKKITLRGGLKESTGGVGFDYYLGRRNYLFIDVWDFGRKDRPKQKNLKPNMQVGINYYLTRSFYIRFGGDDILNDRFRGFFGGAGFLFVDEDLKYLLGGVGIPFQ